MKKIGANKALSETFYGVEPIHKGSVSEKNSSILAKLLTWYSSAVEDVQIEKWLKEYLKSRSFDKKRASLIAGSPMTPNKKSAALLCRIEMNGTVFDKENSGIVERYLSKVEMEITPSLKSSKEENSSEKVVSIRDRIKNIAGQYIIKIEDEIHLWFRNAKKQLDFSMYTFLQKNEVSVPACGFIRQFITPIIEEMEQAKSGSEDYAEAYEYILKTPRKFNAIYDALNEMVSDIDRFTNNVKSTKPRKTRKKKTVTVEKQINKLSYQKEFQQLKIKSIDPSQIIGAQQLWVFNTKYNHLTVYNTDNSAGFKIKGTTLLNVDEKTSVRKKIRKPKQIIDSVLEGGKIVLRKLMNDLTTKPSTINNRINEHTVLLRALK